MTSARCHRSAMRQRKPAAVQARAAAKEAKPVRLRKAAKVGGPVRVAVEQVLVGQPAVTRAAAWLALRATGARLALPVVAGPTMAVTQAAEAVGKRRKERTLV